MVSRESASAIASGYLEEVIQPSIAEEVVLTSVHEFPNNWVVGYNTRAFVETGSISQALAGGGPIIIDKEDGAIRQGTSRVPVEEQVEGEEIPPKPERRGCC